jgi:hypothetical protein
MSEQKQPDKKGSPPTSSNRVSKFEKERKAGETYQEKMKSPAEFKTLFALSSPSASPEPRDPFSSKQQINNKTPNPDFQNRSAFAVLSPKLVVEQYVLETLSSLNNGKSFEKNYVQFYAFIKKLSTNPLTRKNVKDLEETEEEIEELDEEEFDEESEEDVADEPQEIKGQKRVPQNSIIINEILEELDSKIEVLDKKIKRHLDAYRLEQALEDLALVRELLNLKNKLDKDNNAKTLLKLTEILSQITTCQSILMMSPRIDGAVSSFVAQSLSKSQLKKAAEEKTKVSIKKIDPIIEDNARIKKRRPQYWAEFEKYIGGKLLSTEDEVTFQELENQEFDDVETIYKNYIKEPDIDVQPTEAADTVNQKADDRNEEDNAQKLRQLKSLCPKEVKAEEVGPQIVINYYELLKLTLNILDQKRKYLELKSSKTRQTSALKEIFDLLKESSDYLKLFGELQTKITPKYFKNQEGFIEFCGQAKQFFQELQTFFYLRGGYIFSETGNNNAARIFYEQAAIVEGSKDYEVAAEEWAQNVTAVNETAQYNQFFSKLKILKAQKILIDFYISMDNFAAVKETLLQSQQIIQTLHKFKGKEKFIDGSEFASAKTTLFWLDKKIQLYLPRSLHGLLGSTHLDNILEKTPSNVLKQEQLKLSVTDFNNSDSVREVKATTHASPVVRVEVETQNTPKTPALMFYELSKQDPFANYLRKILLSEVSIDKDVSESEFLTQSITKTELKKISEPLLVQIQQSYFDLNFEQGIFLLWRYIEITELRRQVYQEELIPQLVHGYFLLKLFYNKLNWNFELPELVKQHLSVNDTQRTTVFLDNSTKTRTVNSRKYLELMIEPAFQNAMVLGSSPKFSNFCFDYFNLLKNTLGNVDCAKLFYLYTNIFYIDQPKEILRFDFLTLIQKQIDKGDYKEAVKSLKYIAEELMQFFEKNVSKEELINKLKEIYTKLKFCYECLEESGFVKKLYQDEFDLYKKSLSSFQKIKNDGMDQRDKEKLKNNLNKFKERFYCFLEYSECFFDDAEYSNTAAHIFDQFIEIEQRLEKDPEMKSSYEKEVEKDSQQTISKKQSFLSLNIREKAELKTVEKYHSAPQSVASKPEQKQTENNDVAEALAEICKKMQQLGRQLRSVLKKNEISIRHDRWFDFLARTNILHEKTCEIERRFKTLEDSQNLNKLKQDLAFIKERLAYFLSRIFLVHENFQITNILLDQNLEFAIETSHSTSPMVVDQQHQIMMEKEGFKNKLETNKFQRDFGNLLKTLQLQYKLIKFSSGKKVLKDRLVEDCLHTLSQLNKTCSENNGVDFIDIADSLLTVLDQLNNLDPRFLKISKSFDQFINEKNSQRRWQQNFYRWEEYKIRNTSSFFQRHEDKILTTVAVASPLVIYGVVDYCLNQNFEGLIRLVNQNYAHPDLEAYMAYAFFAMVLIALILAFRSDYQNMKTQNPICYLNESKETEVNDAVDEHNVEVSRESFELP